MKIGIDARFYHPRHSGTSRVTRELIKNLSKIDHKNQYILFVTKEGLQAFKADFSKKPKNIKIVIFNHPHYSYAEQFKFIPVIKKENLDLMHFVHINHPIFYKDPYVVTMMDLILYYYPGKERFQILKRWAYNLVMMSAISNAKRIITISNNTKIDLVSKLNANPEKIDVIYPGVDQEHLRLKSKSNLRKILQKYHIDQDYLIYLGQWRVHKNIPRLIRGFAKAVRRGLKSQLVIVGRQDRGTIDLAKLINELGLDGKVILTGFIPDDELPGLYSGASVFAFPSLAEGFGLPPLEAMSRGVPVISSNVSCMPEVLGDAALYFDPYDANDIAKTIEKIMADSDLRKQLIAKGYKQVKKYSWKKMAKETLLVYNKIVKK